MNRPKTQVKVLPLVKPTNEISYGNREDVVCPVCGYRPEKIPRLAKSKEYDSWDLKCMHCETVYSLTVERVSYEAYSTER